MKSVRVFFTKKGDLRFISHLDMNRFFTRVLRKSGLPIWYTEGFNPHPYIAFALPLSLGFESDFEILDFKLTDDNFPTEKVKEALEKVLPCGITVKKVAEPVLKVGKIAFAGYDIIFEGSDIAKKFFEFINAPTVNITKKTKKGELKELEVSSKITNKRCSENIVSVVLTAGNDNINPANIVENFAESAMEEISVRYLRTRVYDEQKQEFK